MHSCARCVVPFCFFYQLESCWFSNTCLTRVRAHARADPLGGCLHFWNEQMCSTRGRRGGSFCFACCTCSKNRASRATESACNAFATPMSRAPPTLATTRLARHATMVGTRGLTT